MRDALLIIFEIFPFLMNFISVVAGILLFFVLRLQRKRYRSAVHHPDHS